jgi:nucleoside-diphosphate-sugar epimerase
VVAAAAAGVFPRSWKKARMPMAEGLVVTVDGSQDRTDPAICGSSRGVTAASVPVPGSQPPQPGAVERTWADLAKAQRLLGYRPVAPIEEGIPRFAAWFKARK